jgi:polar amino acid transport system substrate-binding protein
VCDATETREATARIAKQHVEMIDRPASGGRQRRRPACRSRRKSERGPVGSFPNTAPSEFLRANPARIIQTRLILMHHFPDWIDPMRSQQVLSELAPTGVLRAAINMGNSLLVTGRTPAGDPAGVAPDMAGEIASRLGVPVTYVPYARPGELADAADTDVWDIGLIGAEPQRAEKIAFTPAYVEIEATYMVPPGSRLQSIAEVDRAGVRIAVTARSAYDLWLERNIRHAELVRAEGGDATFKLFIGENLDALAGLRPRLLEDAAKLPGARILDGQFTAVQQAIGTARKNTAGAQFLREFVEEAKKSGLVARLIEHHGVVGRLSVAPAA